MTKYLDLKDYVNLLTNKGKYIHRFIGLKIFKNYLEDEELLEGYIEPYYTENMIGVYSYCFNTEEDMILFKMKYGL